MVIKKFKLIILLFTMLVICGFSAFQISVARSPRIIAAAPQNFIVDTDVDTDDLIAILYLLKNPDVKIAAINIEGDGMTHCTPAYRNLKYLLKLTHHDDIPVACGRLHPLRGNHSVPQKLSLLSEKFTNIPSQKKLLPRYNGSQLIINTLKNATQPLDILAIGPLSTIADSLKKNPRIKKKIRMIYLMGGAISVPGNVHDVVPENKNVVSEWNIYFDPYAAEQVFESKIPITLFPLDITNKVPIDEKFYLQLKQNHFTTEANFVYQLLEQNKKMFLDKIWFFWDPLAAVVATHESLCEYQNVKLKILDTEDLNSGQLIKNKNGTNIRVCTKINSENFKNTLFTTLLFLPPSQLSLAQKTERFLFGMHFIS